VSSLGVLSPYVGLTVKSPIRRSVVAMDTAVHHPSALLCVFFPPAHAQLGRPPIQAVTPSLRVLPLSMRASGLIRLFLRAPRDESHEDAPRLLRPTPCRRFVRSSDFPWSTPRLPFNLDTPQAQYRLGFGPATTGTRARPFLFGPTTRISSFC